MVIIKYITDILAIMFCGNSCFQSVSFIYPDIIYA